MSGQLPNNATIEGIVTARPCGCCGHHEIGIVDSSGEYIPIRPGMQVRIVAQADRHTHE